MPSMNHSGGLALARAWMPPPICPWLNTSNWNACTISCCSTCSSSAYEPVNGSTMRCLNGSVTPPSPSPLASVTFVCEKSDVEAYRMMGFRAWNWWCRMRDSRA